MIKIFSTLALALASCHCLSQGISSKNHLTVNHTYLISVSGKDTVKCLRLSQAEWKKLSEIDQEIRTRGQNVESYLQQKKSGMKDLDENHFTKNILALETLIETYKIPLETSFYRDEFMYYRKRPVKSRAETNEETIARLNQEENVVREKKYQEEIKRREYNKKIQMRNDSIAKVEVRLQMANDSITEMNEKLERTKRRENQRIYALKIKKEQEEKARQEIIRQQSILNKYGTQTGELILDKKVKIGWTKEMCRESWGKPREVNRTTTANVIHEQWVYSLKRYLYFENDVLTAFQD